MRRGEIYLVDFEPTLGSEANKVRPAVIVSNDAANRAAARGGRAVITMVPITSNVGRIFPFQVLLKATECGLLRDSKAQAEQVRAVSASRLSRHLGTVPPVAMQLLDDALRTHLGL
jgi:mRNA interferase MazF